MKRLFCTFVSVAAIAGAQGPMRPMSTIFAALDADRDGTLSASEIAASPSALKALDKNGDGKIAVDEILPFGGREGGRGGRGGPGEGGGASSAVDDLVKTLMDFDRNGNGTLEKGELPERMQGLFDRGDTNKDGVLSAAEVRALAQAQTAAAGGGKREGRGGRGPGQMDPLFAALDTNSDGTISADEIANAATSLKVLDANHDGTITQDEVRPAGGRGRGGE